jgi:hypothetical protein
MLEHILHGQENSPGNNILQKGLEDTLFTKASPSLCLGKQMIFITGLSGRNGVDDHSGGDDIQLSEARKALS